VAEPFNTDLASHLQIKTVLLGLVGIVAISWIYVLSGTRIT